MGPTVKLFRIPKAKAGPCDCQELGTVCYYKKLIFFVLNFFRKLILKSV
jgi:hypothetical protein